MNNDETGTPLQTLRTAITQGDDAAAEAAVQQLSVTDEPQLLVLLDEPTQDAQWWAMRALGAWGTEAALAPVLYFLENKATDLRAVALMALGQLAQRYPSAMQPHLPKIAAHLTDQDGLNRQIAADVLAQCGNNAIPILVDLLRYGTDQSARSRAASALAKIDTPESAPALYHCLNDSNYLVHTYAYEALEKMGLLENTLVTF